MTGYQGRPGGPSDPTTPGPYCLSRCYCRTCPQYPTQHHRTEQLRQQEIDYRLSHEGQPRRRSAS